MHGRLDRMAPRKKVRKKLSAEAGHLSERRGRFGQKMFEAWGAQSDFTPHRADPDINGWDHFVEIVDPNAPRKTALAQVPTVLSCKVQIKTLSADTGRCSLELSTLQKMTDVNAPWFVLVLISSALKDITAAYLLHIDGDRLAMIMRRLRSNPARRPLNKATAQLTWSTADALTPPFGDSFVAAVRAAIRDQREYLDKKLAFVSRVGYARSPFNGSLTIRATRNTSVYESLTQFALGLQPQLKVASVALEEVRFGVTKPLKKITKAGQPALSMKNGPPKMKATIQVTTATDTVSVVCDFYSSAAVFPFLSDEYKRFRFVAGPLSMTLADPGTMSIAFNGDPGPEWSIDVLGRAAKASRLLQDPGVEFIVTVEGATPGPAVGIKKVATLPGDVNSFLLLTELFWNLAHRAGLPADLKVRIGEIIKQQTELSLGTAAIDTRLRIESLSLGPSSVSSAEERVGKAMDAFLCPFVTVGQAQVAAVFVLQGRASRDTESGETTMEKPSIELLKVKVLAKNESGLGWWRSEQPKLTPRAGAEVAFIEPPYV